MPPRLSLSRRPRLVSLVMLVAAIAIVVANVQRPAGQSATPGWRLLAWNNLGMHCMDADFSVFAILPPYNTIQAQLVDPQGRLASGTGGVTLSYRAIADPDGSINTTSAGKTNFWSFVAPLFGAALPIDVGLLQARMPGGSNAAQPMTYDPSGKGWVAEGIPITPYDDAGRKNYYPMMEVRARDAAGTLLASTRIVLPVSDEMDCRACHASGSPAAARPAGGWVFEADAERDYRLNVLRRHDDGRASSPAYQAALVARGYLSTGLYATATTPPSAGGRPVLCAHCHASEALPGSGYAGVPALTAAIHTAHAQVLDPANGLSLGSAANRSACYRCHPGSETRCLRGVMGNAVAADGTMAMQCQQCHGGMTAVGDPTRTGWLDEPTCQQCHTGTAVRNGGAIRFASVFDGAGQPRVAADATFATTPDTPLPGTSLYRFSSGHGGLQCSACHGSTHAEYPSSHRNDNLQSLDAQGHVGTVAECGACHAEVPQTVTGGPHGMHPVGNAWVSAHDSAAGSNPAQCRACHGLDYRGTVLSRAFAARTLTTEFGTKTMFRGSQVSCYMCHNGPTSDSATSNRAPAASNLSVSTTAEAPVGVTLRAADADGQSLTYRIVSQPAGGTVSLNGASATYFPFPGTNGTDTFTYAAWDGAVDSNLATVTVTVFGVPCTISVTASVPATTTVGQSTPFAGNATTSGCRSGVTYRWTFGDGSAAATSADTSHVFASAGTFAWEFSATADGVIAARSGTITVGAVAAAPVITRVRALSSPFRVEISGSNFQAGVRVFVGSQATPWADTQRVSASRLVLSGGDALQALFPRRTPVTLRVVNPDGQAATGTLTRR